MGNLMLALSLMLVNYSAKNCVFKMNFRTIKFHRLQVIYSVTYLISFDIKARLKM